MTTVRTGQSHLECGEPSDGGLPPVSVEPFTLGTGFDTLLLA